MKYDLRATTERKTHYRNDGHEMTKQKKNELEKKP